MKLRCLSLFAAALILGMPLAAQDWVGTFRLSGTVSDEEGNAIEGATVELYLGDPGRGPDPYVTKKNGRWAFLGLKTGVWTVKVEKEGMMPSEGQIQVTSTSPPLRIKLRAIPEEMLYNQRALEAKKQLEEGQAMAQAGDYTGARAKYQEALVNLPPEHHPAVLVAIASAYAEEGDAENRMKSLVEAQTLAPDDASVLLALARAQYDAGEIDTSIATLERVVESEPNNAMVLQVLSDMLVAQGRVDEARQYLDRLPEGTKLDPNALLNVGIDHYNAGEMDAALERFNEVVENYPELPTALYYRGLVHLGRGDNELAASDLKAFLAAEPDSPRADEAKEFLSYLDTGE